MNNPLLLHNFDTYRETIPFKSISPSNIEEAIVFGMKEEKRLINGIIQNPNIPTFANTIQPKTDKVLNRATTILFNLLSANTNDELEAVAERVTPLMTAHSNEILQNKELFERIKFVYQHQENLNNEEKVLLKNVYESFERNGATLNDEEKQRFTEKQIELSTLTLQFNQNILKETNEFLLHIENEEDLSGLPDTAIEAAVQTAKEMGKNGWVFTLHAPSYIPFITYADNRNLRQMIYMAKNTLCTKDSITNNFDIVRQIVNLRMELAQILGFKNHADYVLTKRMAENQENVNNLIERLLDAYYPKAQEELNELLEIAKEIEGPDFQIKPWDIAYYSHKLKLKKYNLDAEMLRPYFKLENVKKGIFTLAERLYGISFELCRTIEPYHPDVETYEVYDADKSFLAVLYVDFFPRKSKQSGAWMTNYREQYIDDNGEDIRPHVSITMNFSKPTEQKPALLTLGEVETFLHEFGHALHSILSKVRFESLSGTNVWWDFVELPSQIMENFVIEPEFLNTFATHYITGEKLPKELIERVIASQNFQCGMACIRQISFCLLDMAYYTRTEKLQADIIGFEQEAWKRAQLTEQVPETCMSTQFGHIFSGGYSAGYYSYKWAEVLDADAFEYFKSNGIFNPKIAKSFREHILSKGATAHPMELYTAFRGTRPTIDALLKRNGIK